MFDDKINMQVPFVNFRVRELGEWTDTNTDTYLKDKRVLVFSLPGAFTPTCSNQQLPGYELKADVFKEHGIDQIYCLSVNDSFVMNAWAADQKLKNIKVIPDGNCTFTDKIGMGVMKEEPGFGRRSWRYSAIINDGIVEKVFEEAGKGDNTKGDPYEVSSPESVLKYLQSTALDSNAI